MQSPCWRFSCVPPFFLCSCLLGGVVARQNSYKTRDLSHIQRYSVYFFPPFDLQGGIHLLGTWVDQGSGRMDGGKAGVFGETRELPRAVAWTLEREINATRPKTVRETALSVVNRQLGQRGGGLWTLDSGGIGWKGN